MGIGLFLLFLILVPGLVAQVMVRSAIKKYSRVPAQSGRSGAQAAAELMADAGIHDVQITRANGFLGDHYDPRTKTLALSPDVYDGHSIAALGIASHETGHAIQHQHLYAPLQVRSTIVPATMFVSQFVWPVVLIGFLLRSPLLIELGIIGYAILLVFQLVTLPVQQLNTAVTGVAFPALSRIQHDAKRLARSFLRGFSLLISTTIPITISCALFAEEIVRVVLGAKWMEAAPIFRLLSREAIALAFPILKISRWLLARDRCGCRIPLSG